MQTAYCAEHSDTKLSAWDALPEWHAYFCVIKWVRREEVDGKVGPLTKSQASLVSCLEPWKV